VKPQLAFLNKPDNTSTDPWKPILTSKPNAIIPLAQSLGKFADEFQHLQYDYTVFLPLLYLSPDSLAPEKYSKSQRQRVNLKKRRLSTMGGSNTTNRQFRFKHPYETEILEMQYPDTVYQKADPISSKDVSLSKAIFVDTFDRVLAMLAELKTSKEIAVDLEHHDARSYVGLVSLMQISTREKDWIIDTLKPWRQDLQVLNEVFADPKIIKVARARPSNR
jgi:exosome complex exonuclease RRP6